MDKAIESVEEIAKKALWDKLISLVVQKIAGKLAGTFFSWLSGPIGWLVGFIGDKIYEVIKLQANYIIIDIRKDIDRAAYDRATEDLKKELQKPERDENAIKEANKKFDDALGDLIHMRGVS